MSLRCSVQVRISGLPAAQADTVMEALGPDNVGMPPGLGISMKSEYDEGDDGNSHHHGGGQESRTLTIQCTSSDADGRDSEAARAMGSLVGAIDEMLEHVQVSLKVVGRDA